MRNSVVRFAAVGAGQDLPGVGREFWGRVSWTTGSSCRAGRPATPLPACAKRSMLVSEPRTGRGSTGEGGGTKMISGGAADLQSRRHRRRCFDGLVQVRLFSRFVVFQGFA